ncbi:serine O-acetyltransferase [Thioclava sp.]|uniref:serine O-acetyltransferase n=1 Tax=Thioclava sp. TaxID=1933450 RepID=UPI003AA89B67
MSFDDSISDYNLDQEATDTLYDLGRLAFDLANSKHSFGEQDAAISSILEYAVQDLVAYHRRDPSVRHKPISCLISQHSTYFAVLCYRIAHHLIVSTGAAREAIHISFAARSTTGTEIHPEARIGQRFVVDHGWGTVVGQTAEIGDDCYILNNVTLGGRCAANAPDGKRHPTLGHRVQICAGANVFGPVHVGNDCFVGPYTTITKDVPAGTTILYSNTIFTPVPNGVETPQTSVKFV